MSPVDHKYETKGVDVAVGEASSKIESPQLQIIESPSISTSQGCEHGKNPPSCPEGIAGVHPTPAQSARQEFLAS